MHTFRQFLSVILRPRCRTKEESADCDLPFESAQLLAAKAAWTMRLALSDDKV